MSQPILPPLFSTVAKLNCLHEPVRLQIAPDPQTPAVEKRANAAKAEVIVALTMLHAVEPLGASIPTTIHAGLLILQETSVAALQHSPANGAAIAERLRTLATLVEAVTPADVAAALDDRKHAHALLLTLKDDATSTIN